MALVQSLQRGIDILFLFDRTRPTISVEEIARDIDIPLATAYRFVATLKQKGLLERESGSGRYSLGLKLLELEELVHAKIDVEVIAPAFLNTLASRTGETVQLTVGHGDYGVCVHVCESASTLRVAPEKGKSIPMHAGASVQAILAFRPREEQERILKGPFGRFTPNTITTSTRLRKRLALIRKKGYAISCEEVITGAMGVAAPIHDRNGIVNASVAVSGPIHRMEKNRATIINDVVLAATRISDALSPEGEMNRGAELSKQSGSG